MTVSYTAEVAHCTGFGCFPKLLLRWRASIYKLIWKDVLVYVGIYYALNLTYRFWLNDEQKKFFEVIVKYCNNSSAFIPLMFVLGFYVSIVVKRWWEQYMTLPWPDSTAVYVSSLIRGLDENGRKMRRTIMRYVCLSLTMVLSMISPRVKKRFPTLDHLVDAGLLIENEKVILQNMNEKFAKHPKHWMPIVWASSIVTRARKEGRIRDDSSLKTLIDSLNDVRGMCMVLLFYDTISIPLVYTQVVTIAVYAYFLASVFGRQWTGQTNPEGVVNIVDYFFPFFTVLEYMFFMGWLKVAESLISPFGDDDDDFEVNWLIDRNLQVSYLIVDEMHNEHPELIKDQYWDEVFPATLPRVTEYSLKKGFEDPPRHSTATMDRQPSKRMTLGEVVLQSITRFLSKKSDREEAPSINTNESVTVINTVFEGFLNPSEISEEQKVTSSTELFEESIPTKQVQITSDISFKTETSYQRSSANVDEEDDFEKLKQQREKARILRQKPLVTMQDNTAGVNEARMSVSSRSSKESQKESASEISMEFKENETKKDV